MGEKNEEKRDWRHVISIVSLVSYLLFASCLSIEALTFFVYKDPIAKFSIYGTFASLLVFTLNAFFIIRKHEQS